MLLMRPSLTFLFLLLFFIQPAITTVSTDIQHLDSDDIATLPKQIPSMIDKIGETLRRFRCPKGWKRFGGSCYYFPNVTSFVSHVNYSCNSVHSNRSNLLQIRNAIQLFYAAYVLSTNNLESLVIEIDSSLPKGKDIIQRLMNDKNRSNKLKNESRQIRLKYNNLTKTILRRLNSHDLRISRRSKQINSQSINDKSNSVVINDSSVNEYEYEDLNSLEDEDESEYFERIRDICDDIHWNVLNNTHNTTVYILSRYQILDKEICSLTDVEPDMEYHYVCEYVLDYCIGNILCGKHGHCVNTLTSFKCSCDFLYGGLWCKKLTKQGIQILIGIGFAVIMSIILFIYDKIRSRKQKQKNKKKHENNVQSQVSTPLLASSQTNNNTRSQESDTTATRKQTTKKTSERIFCMLEMIFVANFRSCLILLIFAIIWSSLYLLTFWVYIKQYNVKASGDIDPKHLPNVTMHLVTKCRALTDYRQEYIIFAPYAIGLIIVFSFCIRRKKRCLRFPPAIEPFYIKNRFATATIFGLITFQVLKIFEALLFNLYAAIDVGVIIDLLIRIASVFLAGLQYYPVLTSLRLWNPVARWLTFLYIIGHIIYTIIREGSCMAYIPLSNERAAIEEATVRIELGTWFVLYGLVKNTPHFIFLSYIGAELGVRFIYDSVIRPCKENRSIWSPPADEQVDDLKSSENYVKNRLRSQGRSAQTPIVNQASGNLTQEIENEDEEEDTDDEQEDESWYKKLFTFIFESDKSFRFTTMVVCTYTVAFVFLYYLVCTFLFLYLSRTTGHLGSIKYYVESLTNKELGEIPFIPEIIISAVVTVINYVIQLLLGLQQFKTDKKELNKKLGSKQTFYSNSVVSNSAHYSGFLIEYLAWGFVLFFHLILFLGIILIRIIYPLVRHRELLLAIIVPLILMSQLRDTIKKLIEAVLFNKNRKRKRANDGRLHNPGAYAIFIYFMFFADCFLGIASAVLRLLKATFLHIMCMGRLDCSFFGGQSSKHDSAYTTYNAYLRMEVNYTREVTNIFISSLWQSIKKHPHPRYYDEGCCTTLDNADTTQNSNQNQTNPSNVISKPNINGSTDSNNRQRTNLNQNNVEIELTQRRETSLSARKNNAISETGRDNQQTSNISDIHVNIDQNMNSSTSPRSSTSKREQLSPESSSLSTQAIVHQEPSFKRHQSDEDDRDRKSITNTDIKTISSPPKAAVKARKRGFEPNRGTLPDENKSDKDNVGTYNITEPTSSFEQFAEDDSNPSDELSFLNSDNTRTPGTKSLKGASAAVTFRTISENFPKTYDDERYTRFKKPINKHIDQTRPIVEDQRVNQTTTTGPPSTNTEKLSQQKPPPLRSISYYTSIQQSPSIDVQSSINFSPVVSEDNTDDHLNIATDTNPVACNDSPDSTTELTQLVSSHFSEPQTTTRVNTIELSNEQIILRRKRARTRWHLACILITNPSLQKLRKKVLQQEQYHRLRDQ